MKDIIEINYNGETLAIIITEEFQKEGIHFCTPDDYSQQLAYMHHREGKIIEPHVHNQIKRNVHHTQEVLFIKKGRMRVDFFTQNREYIKSYVLNSGDVILLASGGHGFEVLEEVVMFEVKQGPYLEGKDKEKFSYLVEKPQF